MSPLLFVRRAATAAMAAGILALCATDAQATHFRYGTIKWRVTDPTPDPTPNHLDLEVTAECAWRRSYYSPPPNPGGVQDTGQDLRVTGVGVNLVTNLIVDVSAINITEDWFVGARTFNFSNIPRAGLPLNVFWTGNARISTLMDNNNDDFFNVEARVSIDQTNLFSPVTNLLPILNVAHGQPAASFFIPATDPEGDTLTWTIATTARSLLTKAAPDGADDVGPPTLSIDSSTGQVTWNTAVELPPLINQELYAVQFLITDSKGGQVPADTLLRIVPNTSQPPVALIDDSPDPASFDVSPGDPISFVFKGTDPDLGDVITMAGGGMPPGSSFTPTLPFSGPQPQSATFNWTPTLADVGAHIISLSVTDPFAIQDQTSVTITVLPNFQPDVECPLSRTKEATGVLTPHTAVAKVMDPEGEPLTVKWFVDGILRETDNVPATPPPTQTTVDFLFDYALGPSALKVEVSDGLTNTVVCNATITIEDTVGPVIALPPSQIVEATSPAGAPATWSPDPPTAEDVVDGAVPVTCSHSSGAIFPILPPPPASTTTTVTCTAEDLSDNETTGTFNIVVQDTTAPVISNMPADILVPSSQPGGGAIVTWPSPTAFDIVDQAVAVNCVPPSGSFFPVGTTTVVCTASDVRGNSSSKTFTVTVQEIPPVPCITVTPGALWPPNHKMRDVAVQIQAPGIPPPVCAITSVTSTEPVAGQTYGQFVPDWIFDGLNLQLRAERYDHPGRTYTVTVTCTSSGGTVASDTVDVVVPHDMSPKVGPGSSQSGSCNTVAPKGGIGRD
jgi:hypothetical protein